MRKFIITFFVLLIFSQMFFADEKRFYYQENMFEVMYVNSEDGLRVRDNPSLKSNRICVIPYRLPVKIVEIGKEETIDGITDPWIKIELPFYEWKDGQIEYGWVFGGYLSEKCPEVIYNVNSAKSIQNTLVSNLWRIQVNYDEFAIIKFFQNGLANIFLYGKEFCSFKYYIVDNKTIKIEIPARKVISEWPRLAREDGSIDENGFLDKRSVYSGSFKITFNDYSFKIDNCALHGSITNYNFGFYCEFGSKYEEYIKNYSFLKKYYENTDL